MFAIVNIAGKQYRVAKGDQIKVARLDTESGENVKFDQVLLTDDGKNVQVGAPTVKGASVSGTVLDNGRNPKVIVFKKKRRKGYRRKNGHRQDYSLIQIDEIFASAPKKKSAPKKAAAKAEKKED
ncbi:MAG: 50S ribosomal protein L21 [Candidatus Marinimicrobia bacterium]|jgi:large subunit ribosomal protein L21|nr:50S ribosomal protein L21 [Candidatus Neomarinimicrobiota bacterium]MDP6339825.1 50S ribosomal protein L21 [Candidatus Neomarinimicrobiota bacterium]MDP6611613.1 50S ribosomal protein L21 [Candidatus Neomarinimicrobiota bacterium]|tara:strand:- start:35987 stop:36361 length:375 start_codon:yes stop_codon:yes gene_type:complete